MKHAILALSFVAVLGLGACSNNSGSWTPMSGGRTAGEGTVEKTTVHQADKTFSHSLHK